MRGTPMSKEDVLGREEGDDGAEPGTSSQRSSSGPTEPVSREMVAGGHVGPGGLLQDRRVRMIGVGLIAVMLAVVAFLNVMPKGSKGESLSLKFQPGQEGRYRALMFFNGTRDLPRGKQEPLNLTMGATLETKVVSADGNGATLDVTVSNFALHSGTPTLDVVPETIHGQIVLDRNGAVTSGGLGLSAGVSSKVIPGWDVLVPILPQGAVLPEATWNSATDVAFVGSDTVRVSADSSVSFLDGDSGRVGVVTSKMTIPVDTTVSMGSVAEALGVGVDQLGFPEGSDPKFTYKGSIRLDTVSRIDVSSGEIISTSSRGTAAAPPWSYLATTLSSRTRREWANSPFVWGFTSEAAGSCSTPYFLPRTAISLYASCSLAIDPAG